MNITSGYLFFLALISLPIAGYVLGRETVLRDPEAWGHQTLGEAWAKCRQQGGYLQTPFMGDPWRCQVSKAVKP